MTTPEVDVEAAVIGLAMSSRDALLDMPLTAADFADPSLGALWGLMADMDAAGEPVTPATVLAALPRITLPLNPGERGPWVSDLYAARPVPALAERYAAIIANSADLRRLRVVGERIMHRTMADADAQEVAEAARGELDAANRATADAHLIGETIDATIDSLEQPSTAMPTPWIDLDRLIRGWRPGALYVIGARPGVGKSICAIQAAIGLADHGHVALNSLEMPAREIHTRVIANVATVALGRLDGTAEVGVGLSDRDWRHIAEARQRLATMRLSIDDRSTAGILDVRSHARTLSRRGPLSAVIVDYLQLMSTPRGDRRPRHEVVADFSRSLKILAKELNVPVIALSQLNRASEGRGDRRPVLADLRESGAVEQDADVVILLHAPDEDSDDLDLIVAKNRHGIAGKVSLTRRGEYARVEPRRWVPTRTYEASA